MSLLEIGAEAPLRTSAHFWALWGGQLVSLVGSGTTSFALGVWVFQRTGSTVQLALVALCAALPGLLLSPVAGTLIDRWNLRSAMLLSDGAAALVTVVVAILLLTDRLAPWHLYVTTAVSSAFTAFHWPAYVAATSRLVPAKHWGRLSGAVQATESSAQLIAPALGGLLLASVGLSGVVLLDLATFVVALTALLATRVPSVPRPCPGALDTPSLWRETAEGWAYITSRPGLVGLVALSCVMSLGVGFLEILSAPIVLSFASPAALGTVRSFAGGGMLLGSLAMSIWGGPKNRIAGIVVAQAALGMHVALMGLHTAVWFLAAAGFVALFTIPVINGCTQTIWQTKVSAHLHGRVFALRRLAILSRPAGYFLAGFLAERVFEPLMTRTDVAPAIGSVIGTGPGRGSALLLLLVGAFTVAATLAAARYRPLRCIQEELPDAC
ncbi:MFS transporter [Nannocystis sp. ILAH1]|uniref:MFS transporter n=1 Tax=unclassified Nannocystis TaxID=2627009 RepID=UPI00226F096C|nr:MULTISPECIES: MFS transporter [unclassified Nannocystis]MCY0989538.1 MFS transporter [Nannocystis sp. ILAH1]MCY1064842.1 MFS transporter [Nannocystis sp. RBIL2]